MTDSIPNDNITDPGLWLWQGRPTNERLRRLRQLLLISGLMLSALAFPVAALGIFALSPGIFWHHETGTANQKAVMPYPPRLPILEPRQGKVPGFRRRPRPIRTTRSSKWPHGGARAPSSCRVR